MLFGKKGESRAAKYLLKKGYDIVERNYRSPHGEIDIIAKNRDRIVFIEVKTRSGTAYGEPEEAITNQKKIHILNSAEYYLKEHFQDDVPVDFEVISIIQGKRECIRHLKLFD